MEILGIITGILLLFFEVKLFKSAVKAEIVESERYIKIFYIVPALDLILFFIIGGFVVHFFVYTAMMAYYFSRAISTEKMISGKNLKWEFYFVTAGFLCHLDIVSGSFVPALNIIELGYFSIPHEFFIGLAAFILLSFFVVIVAIIFKSRYMWVRQKSMLLRLMIFTFLSLYAFGLYYLLLGIYSILNIIPIVMIIALISISRNTKMLVRELNAFKLEDPFKAYMSSETGMLEKYEEVNDIEFEGFRKKSKSKMMKQQPQLFETEQEHLQPAEDPYEMPKNCVSCKKQLTEQGYCPSCKKKICPKCFSLVQPKSQLCSCGYIFKFRINTI